PYLRVLVRERMKIDSVWSSPLFDSASNGFEVCILIKDLNGLVFGSRATYSLSFFHSGFALFTLRLNNKTK
ncbi:MAG: hypothetical protein VW622_07920, partial [Opitutae bacterium]